MHLTGELWLAAAAPPLLLIRPQVKRGVRQAYTWLGGYRSVWVGRAAAIAGVLGAAIALWLLLLLPPATDVYAVRRCGVDASYVGFILGFSLGALGVPLAMALPPLRLDDDASRAGAVIAVVATIVGSY